MNAALRANISELVAEKLATAVTADAARNVAAWPHVSVDKAVKGLRRIALLLKRPDPPKTSSPVGNDKRKELTALDRPMEGARKVHCQRFPGAWQRGRRRPSRNSRPPGLARVANFAVIESSGVAAKVRLSGQKTLPAGVAETAMPQLRLSSAWQSAASATRLPRGGSRRKSSSGGSRRVAGM